jgi:hypothetical protein
VVDFVDSLHASLSKKCSIYAGRRARAPGTKPCGSVLEFSPLL